MTHNSLLLHSVPARNKFPVDRALSRGLCLGIEETLGLETGDIMVAVSMLMSMLQSGNTCER